MKKVIFNGRAERGHALSFRVVGVEKEDEIKSSLTGGIEVTSIWPILSAGGPAKKKGQRHIAVSRSFYPHAIGTSHRQQQLLFLCCHFMPFSLFASFCRFRRRKA